MGADGRRNPAENKADGALALALDAMAYILGEEDARERFVAVTGAGAAEMRAGAGDPAFLAGVLDFMLADESMLLAWCARRGHDPGAALRARRILPGGRELEG